MLVAVGSDANARVSVGWMTRASVRMAAASVLDVFVPLCPVCVTVDWHARDGVAEARLLGTSLGEAPLAEQVAVAILAVLSAVQQH